jgi:hypothetical protein
MSPEELKEKLDTANKRNAALVREKDAYQREWHAEILARRGLESRVRDLQDKVRDLANMDGHITKAAVREMFGLPTEA